MSEVPPKKERFESLEDLDIGSVLSKKLRELGFHTVENLAMATPKELEQAGIDKKNAKNLIRKARSSIPLQFIPNSSARAAASNHIISKGFPCIIL